MRFSKLTSAQHHLLASRLISVETDISKGLHAFSIVGLPDKAVEEARDRVNAAIKNSGFKPPKQTNAKIIVSLAPADIKKGGPAFDLPIALGYLLAAGEISFDPKDKLFVGELALDGNVRGVEGALSYARLARKKGIKEIYVPLENAAEAALLGDICVYGIECLSDLIAHLDPTKVCGTLRRLEPALPTVYESGPRRDTVNLDDIVGHETAKRGLLIAAAGRHNIALFGPPGTGKTMLARALSSIMPALTYEQTLEATEIHSITGALDGSVLVEPPMRALHHTSSYSSIVGGGNPPKPGEITLAHRGILFMDEFPEFDKRVIEALRQPLEDKVISISRGRSTVRFPADFILIASLNPCPCGNRNMPGKECRCSPADFRRYERKLSGPIVDRIDMWIEVSKVDHKKLIRSHDLSAQTERARQLIDKARAAQQDRFARLGIETASNASVSARDMSRACELSGEATAVLNAAAEKYSLSGRGYHRVAKLARTIADISGAETIEAPHILEALQYRQRRISPQ